MATTIDHLRQDHRITILRDFTDQNGTTLHAGDTGVVRRLGFNQVRMEIHIAIERAVDNVNLVFPLKAATGPRIGHMRDYFRLGEDVSEPRAFPAHQNFGKRKMRIPAEPPEPATRQDRPWSQAARDLDGPDRLEDVERQLLQTYQHIGVAASIAEIYAERMRAFQHLGNEVRAAAAFKLAMDWMYSHAGSATSGGEGAALSQERDDFHAALIREFGYDPTEEPPDIR